MSVNAQGSLLPLCALAIAAGGALGWLLHKPAPPPATPVARMAAPAPAPASQAPVVVAAAAPSKQGPAPAAPKAMGRFSNGVKVALLNGVTEPVDLAWPADWPWSPVKETVRDERGIDWYRHADGSMSTTLVRTDEATGKQKTMGLVYTPGGEPLPSAVRNVDLAPPAKSVK